jgi:glycosyltransferase involved in cell wall biosynthesis
MPREIVFVEVASHMSGVEFSTLYLVQRLDLALWRALVICPTEGDLPTRCRDAGVEVAIVPRPHFFSTSAHIGELTIINPMAILFNLGAMWLAARTLRQFLWARQPSLLVTKGLLAQFYGGLAARWTKIPCVWHVQDRVSDRAGPLFAWVLALAGRVLAREIIVDADSIASQLQSFISVEHLHVIWNGVDTREFSPCVDGRAVRAEWGARADELLVGVIGRLTAWKGQHILLEAFQQVAADYPQLRMVIVGSSLFDSDAYARRLRSDVTRMGLTQRVIFAGFRWDMPQVLAALDVIAHTSLEKDSTPLAVVSAMAAGKPIVCSRVDGTAQLFDDGADGLLVPAGDADALARQLSRLLSDASLRQRLGQAARAKAERALSVEQFARSCESVFERALA